MDFYKISSLINRYRPMQYANSLPFLMKEGDGFRFVWFNYWVDEKGDDLKFSVTSIVSCSEEGDSVSEEKVNIQIQTKLEEYFEPPMEPEEYFERLCGLKNDFSEEAQLALIRQAELIPVIPIYLEVIKFRKGE